MQRGGVESVLWILFYHTLPEAVGKMYLLMTAGLVVLQRDPSCGDRGGSV